MQMPGWIAGLVVGKRLGPLTEGDDYPADNVNFAGAVPLTKDVGRAMRDEGLRS